MGSDPFAAGYDEMARRDAPGSRQPTPVQPDSPSSPLALACVAVVGAVSSVLGARVSVGVMTEGGPSLVGFGSIGTAYLVGRSWYRNRQGTHWFELQQTRAAFRTHLQPGCWSMPDLAGELQSHFPREMGLVLEAWHLAPPDGSGPAKPDVGRAELSRVRGLAFDGLSQISKAERLTRSCSRCKRRASLRHLPWWDADVQHPPPAVLG